MVSNEELRSGIVFFDLETTIPTRPGQAYAILEFGSIFVCPQKFIELDSFETLVRPFDLSLITPKSFQCNGITAEDVVSSPTFLDIADKVYDILHGRVWAGHNILRFDCVRLREAYAQIKRQPPVPKGTIDTLQLLRERFGTRAGDMKMASLAAYFGLGQQSHRSLGDVRMNLEVVKCCASVLFLESSQQDTFTENTSSSMNATIINRCNGKSAVEGTCSNVNPILSTRNIENDTFPPNHVPNPVQSGSGLPVDNMETDSRQSNEAMVDESSSTTTLSNAYSNHTEFIVPDAISMASITITVAPFFHGSNRMQILHRDIPLQIQCNAMRIRFGLSTQFVDHAGKPRLSFVLDANSNLCNILDTCDNIAKRFVTSDSNPEWRPAVTRKPGFYDSPTIRLHLPTEAGNTTKWITEIFYKKSSSPSIQPLISSSYDVEELNSLFQPGFLVDAYFSLDPYNYQQNAGIRLVAKKLIVHTN